MEFEDNNSGENLLPGPPEMERQRSAIPLQAIDADHSAVSSLKKDVVYKSIIPLVAGLYLLACNLLTDPSQSCSFKHSYQFVNVVLIWALIPFFVVRLFCFCQSSIHAIKDVYIASTITFHGLFGVIALMGYVRYFGDFPKACFQEFDLVFVNAFILLAMGLPHSIALVLGTIVCIFGCPFVSWHLWGEWANERMDRQLEAMEVHVDHNTQQQLMGKLLKTTLREHTDQLDSYDYCIICYKDFEGEDEVTPLPCDIKHFYHSGCITIWFRDHDNCPICKTRFTVEELDQFEQDFLERFPRQQ